MQNAYTPREIINESITNFTMIRHHFEFNTIDFAYILHIIHKSNNLPITLAIQFNLHTFNRLMQFNISPYKFNRLSFLLDDKLKHIITQNNLFNNLQLDRLLCFFNSNRNIIALMRIHCSFHNISNQHYIICLILISLLYFFKNLIQSIYTAIFRINRLQHQ